MNNEFDNNNIETTNIQSVAQPKSNKKIILIVLFVLILLVSAGIVLYTQTDIFKKDKETNNDPKASEKKENTNTQIDDDVNDNDDVNDEYDGENLAVQRYSFKDAKNSCVTYGSTEYSENESGYITYVSDINIDGKNYKLAYGNDFSKQFGIRTLNGKHIEGFDTNTTEMLPVSLCVYGKYIVLQTGWEGAYTHVISPEGKSITGFGGTYEVTGENKIHIDEYDCSVDTNGKHADSHNEYDIDFNSNPLEKLDLKQTYYNCDEAPF